MPTAGRTSARVLDARQVRTLNSPGRLEVIEAVAGLGPASARDIARHLGRSPGAVYHHVRALEAAGLLRATGHRAGTRRPEALYDLTASRLAVAVGRQAGDGRHAVATLRSVLRQAARDAERVFGREDVKALAGRTQGGQLTAPLSSADVRKVIRRLGEIEGIFRDANRRRRRGRDIYRWTSLLLPVRAAGKP